MSDLEPAASFLSVDVLRAQIAPGASDAELAHFARVCRTLNLSPWAGQIVLIGRHDRRVNRDVYRHQITVDGRRALAVRTGLLEGIDGPVWCGPRVRGELEWREMWDSDDKPYCARVLVHVKGWQVPANGTAKWDEFAQYQSDGKTLLPLWARMPSHMLGKVAESMALRRAFPDAIDPAVDTGYYPPPVDGDGDLAEITEAEALEQIRPGDWQPSLADQSDAHRIIGELSDEDQERFLADWRIDDFHAPWPADAVADALSRKPS